MIGVNIEVSSDGNWYWSLTEGLELTLIAFEDNTILVGGSHLQVIVTGIVLSNIKKVD